MEKIVLLNESLENFIDALGIGESHGLRLNRKECICCGDMGGVSDLFLVRRVAFAKYNLKSNELGFYICAKCIDEQVIYGGDPFLFTECYESWRG